jgi:hypothetical protein
MAANDVDLVFNVSHAINPLEDAVQHFLEIERRNTSMYGEHTVTTFELKTIATAAKMNMVVERSSSPDLRVAPFSGSCWCWFSLFY